MNSSQSLRWVSQAIKRCQGNTRAALIAVLLVAGILVAGTPAHASTGRSFHGTTVKVGVAAKSAGTVEGPRGSYCQAHVERGILTVTSEDYPTGYTSSRVTYRGEVRAEYHGYLVDGVWTQDIGPWYVTDDVKAWVHGIPCAHV